MTESIFSSRVTLVVQNMSSAQPDLQHNSKNIQGVTFIVPCFNEAPDVLQRTVARLQSAATTAQWPYEVIVVDDASIERGYDTYVPQGAILVRHKVNRGYGAALSTGLRHATFQWIGIVDADGTYPVEKFPDMLRLTSDYQMIIGARGWADINWLRRIPKRFLTQLASFLADSQIPDLNSGMRIFHREIYDGHSRIYPDRFSFSSTLTMVGLTSGFEVAFLPIEYFRRIGRSTIHPIKDPLRFCYQLLRLSLYFRPLRFFVPLATAVGLLAVARGIRDLLLSNHFGGLTLVLFFMAFQIFFFGLIAEIINKK